MGHILGSLGVVHALNLHKTSVRMRGMLVARVAQVSGPARGPISALSHIAVFASDCNLVDQKDSLARDILT
jgi:hypothetical protein